MRIAASAGDYSEADGELARLAEASAAFEPGVSAGNGREQVLASLVRALHEGGVVQASIVQRVLGESLRSEAVSRAAKHANALRQEADVRAMRGLLRLEMGEIDQASGSFESALKLVGASADARGALGLDFLGRRAARECLSLIRSGNRPVTD